MEEPLVRRMKWDDLEAVVSLDQRITGRRRTEYFRLKLKETLSDTGLVISLAAEVDGRIAGFLLARVYYGEFGLVEPAAFLDTLGVHPDLRGRGVASALLDQLQTDLTALRVGRLQTEIDWDDPDLLTFFQHEGFRPASRLCLDLDLTLRVRRSDRTQ